MTFMKETELPWYESSPRTAACTTGSLRACSGLEEVGGSAMSRTAITIEWDESGRGEHPDGDHHRTDSA